MIDFFSDERRQHRANKKALRLREAERKALLRRMLDTYVGRATLWSVLEKCGVYATSFCTDPVEMAYREGRRSVGLELLQEVFTLSPNAYTIMGDEARVRESRHGIKGAFDDNRDDEYAALGGSETDSESV